MHSLESCLLGKNFVYHLHFQLLDNYNFRTVFIDVSDFISFTRSGVLVYMDGLDLFHHSKYFLSNIIFPFNVAIVHVIVFLFDSLIFSGI